MYAVIRSGGKQYRVAKDDVLELERLDGVSGDKIKLNEVLMIGEAGKSPTIGDPLVKGASVTLEVLNQVRADKIDVIKFKRRQNYHRQLGHKQHLTKVKVSAISKSASTAKAKAKAADEAPSETASDAQADKE